MQPQSVAMAASEAQVSAAAPDDVSPPQQPQAPAPNVPAATSPSEATQLGPDAAPESFAPPAVRPAEDAPAHSHPPTEPPNIQETVRRLIPVLDRALQSGSLSGPAEAIGAALRHTAERLVHAMQFQQLQTVLQPTQAEPYVMYALPAPPGQGEGELLLYVRDKGGSPKIDPEDVRLVIDLRLSQLKRVCFNVHLFHRQLSCHVEAESLDSQRLIQVAAPELRDNLHGLGFAVDPIQCTMAGRSRSASSEASLPLTKLGRLNVTA